MIVRKLLLRGFDQLDEHAVGGVRMEKRDPGSPGTPPRGCVDRAKPGRLRPGQRLIQIRHLKRQVVNPLPALPQKSDEGAGGSQRLEQLDPGVPHRDERDPDVLSGNRLPPAHHQAEPAVACRRGLMPADDDPEMPQAGAHPA